MTSWTSSKCHSVHCWALSAGAVFCALADMTSTWQDAGELAPLVGQGTCGEQPSKQAQRSPIRHVVSIGSGSGRLSSQLWHEALQLLNCPTSANLVQPGSFLVYHSQFSPY